MDMSAEAYGLFLSEKGPAVRGADHFEILLGEKYKDTYETFKKIIFGKWSAAATHTYSPTCGPCMLAKSAPEVDPTLLTLFYACAPVTRKTVLDAMVCLSMLYGLRRCCNLVSPLGVYFHFFMHHCATSRGAGEEDQSEVCDFVTRVMHSFVYDVPEVDAMALFINTNLTTESTTACTCNEAQKALDAISGRREVEEETAYGPFMPDFSQQHPGAPVAGWANSYKWGGGSEDGSTADDDSVVDFFSIFTDCRICDEMVDYRSHERLRSEDKAIALNREFMNVSTAVSVACQPSGRDYTDWMIRHYTDAACGLNRLKFINFYSLVKQPQSLKSGAASHLLSELFSSKRSYLCPVYHLACLSHRILSAEESLQKKTKKESVQKWAHKVLKRHVAN